MSQYLSFLKNLLKIILICLRGCNTSSDYGIISQYETMGASVLFWVFSCLVILKTLAKSTLSYSATAITGG
ncbi:MAG: hypothetical protein EWV84_17310 [Microcystis sp. M_QC_C_20170808_M3Col]|nr:MAG: hypothetical protein EWV84_17310 [Microcystis sp. M_QC_C_20170808_M3Col]